MKTSLRNETAMRAKQYNDQSGLQGQALRPALELLPHLGDWNMSYFCIYDYGCSQGRNSVRSIAEATATLPSGTAVQLGFNDRRLNDWATLMREVENNMDTLSHNGRLRVFYSLVPRSFFSQTAPQHGNLGLSFSSMHYLEHALPPLVTLPTNAFAWEMEYRQATKAVSRQELAKFFRHRAAEIVTHGTFIAAFPCQQESDDRVWFHVSIATRTALLSAVADGLIPESAVLNYSDSMVARTLEHVKSALEEVKDVWEIEALFVRDIEHPSNLRFVDGDSEYTRIIVAAGFAIYTPFIIRALRSTSSEAHSSLVETADENRVVKELETRTCEYYLQQFKSCKLWIPFAYLRLRRI